MEPKPMKCGVLIAAAPGSASFAAGLNAAEQALFRGDQVYLYCIDQGVDGLSDGKFEKLREAGAKLFACAYSLQKRNLSEETGATPSGLSILSDIIASTDEFLSFT
jgi:predicted peroxiredoxin